MGGKGGGGSSYPPQLGQLLGMQYETAKMFQPMTGEWAKMGQAYMGMPSQPTLGPGTTAPGPMGTFGSVFGRTMGQPQQGVSCYSRLSNFRYRRSRVSRFDKAQGADTHFPSTYSFQSFEFIRDHRKNLLCYR